MDGITAMWLYLAVAHCATCAFIYGMARLGPRK